MPLTISTLSPTQQTLTECLLQGESKSPHTKIIGNFFVPVWTNLTPITDASAQLIVYKIQSSPSRYLSAFFTTHSGIMRVPLFIINNSKARCNQLTCSQFMYITVKSVSVVQAHKNADKNESNVLPIWWNTYNWGSRIRGTKPVLRCKRNKVNSHASWHTS